jgi:hypothetical protein
MADESPRVIACHIDPARGRVIFGRLNRYLVYRNIMADEPPRVIAVHIVPVRGRVIFGRFGRHPGQLAVTGLHCLGHTYSFSLAFAHLKGPLLTGPASFL